VLLLELAAAILLGRSQELRPIHAYDRGRGATTVLVVGCIHGDECAGLAVTRELLRLPVPDGVRLVVVPNLNPDGFEHRTRGNARGVDLNRNFPAGTERETRIAMKLIRRVRPDITLWFHQPQWNVRAWGDSVATAQRYAQLVGLPFRRLRWPNGSATRWQNLSFPGTASFVVELPPGPVTRPERYARAVLALAE
jgi:protein MpaA